MDLYSKLSDRLGDQTAKDLMDAIGDRDNLATKNDLRELASITKNDLRELASITKNDLLEVASAAKNDLVRVAAELEVKIHGAVMASQRTVLLWMVGLFLTTWTGFGALLLGILAKLR
jgi:hypothetical protein